MAVKLTRDDVVIYGFTCGKRSNGDRCVLWDGDMFEWFSAEEFANLFG